MKISDKGLDLIKSFEGLRLGPYLDSGGIATIGYGNIHYTNGTRVKIDDPSITEERALELLECAVNGVGEHIDSMVAVPISQNQFDALCSLAYNIGTMALQTSTLLFFLNQKLYTSAASQFLRWDHVAGMESGGLLDRRTKEMNLFLED